MRFLEAGRIEFDMSCLGPDTEVVGQAFASPKGEMRKVMPYEVTGQPVWVFGTGNLQDEPIQRSVKWCEMVRSPRLCAKMTSGVLINRWMLAPPVPCFGRISGW